MFVRRFAVLLSCSLFLLACGDKQESAGSTNTAAGSSTPAALSEFEVENGIGPVKEAITLGPLNQGMVTTGKAAFEAKCTACHKMTERYVGPELGEVTTRRSPAFVMNMILNPQEMVERHPAARQMLAEYMTYMANQGVILDEARAILEYLRTQATGPVRTK